MRLVPLHRFSPVALALAELSCAGAPEPAAPPAPTPAASAAASAPASAAAPASGSASVKPAGPKVSALEQIQADAKRLAAIVGTPFVKQFLAATARLPHIAPRTLHHDEKKRYFTEREALALPEPERAKLTKMVADDEFYYNTKYGSPLSYSRPLDILASRGLSLGSGSKVLDFGFGYVGHLRLFALLGIDATGIDVDPMLRALYSEPGDQGAIDGRGRVRLILGEFPKDPSVVAAAGGGYDLVISKNVLKKGYIHPDRPADEKHLIRLGVSDEVVLKAFFAALKPGGWMLVYNICPAPSPPDKPFVPWSDGRSPYTKAQWEAAGFKVLAFDQDDTAAVRVMGRALRWDAEQDGEKWDIEHDLSVLYTLVERPR